MRPDASVHSHCSVASGVWPEVAGVRPATRPTTPGSRAIQGISRPCLARTQNPPGGTPRLYGRQDARRLRWQTGDAPWRRAVDKEQGWNLAVRGLEGFFWRGWQFPDALTPCQFIF